VVGRSLSHYKVLEEISRGGMGIVYRALDVKLNREVALKVLPTELVADPERKRRFILEAQAAAALDHPHIAVVYEIDEAEGITFIALELIRGEKLSDHLGHERLSVDRSLELAIQVAEGLERAHEKGIVHRDLKPANVMVTGDGRAKLIDFGLAKLVEPERSSGSDIETALREKTRAGVVMGTISYMSPEQARGRTVDHRTDIFAFGILIHEMLTGEAPFRGQSAPEIQHAIIHDSAPRLSSSRVPERTVELQRIVDRCLAKAPEDRFQQMSEVLSALRAVLQQRYSDRVRGLGLLQSIQRPTVALAGILLLVLIGILGVRAWQRNENVRWAREEALPEIARLVERDEYGPAYHLARAAAEVLPDDPTLVALWDRLSKPVSITTEPPGAEVFFQSFPEGGGEEQHLGTTPIDGQRVPLGSYWLRFEKKGFLSRNQLVPSPELMDELRFQLASTEGAPEGMVYISPLRRLRIGLAGFDTVRQFESAGYWIDEHEVSNAMYRQFVESGGYENQEYWAHDVIKDGQVLSFEASRSEFRDQTGRPGPSTWAGGTFPEGQEDYPVSGVSWYEAAAYTRFAGRSLPTVYHWGSATSTYLTAAILSFSNFDGRGPEPVMSRPPGLFGTRHMAGNVKEWCWNESSGRRYILGGAWNEPTHMFFEADLRPPLDRSSNNGFRTTLYLDPNDPVVVATKRPLVPPARRTGRIEAVSDEIFEAYKTQFAYDPTPLEAVSESIDEKSQYWKKERITFNAAYANERIIAYLFVPTNVDPPYQTILYFPGAGAVRVSSSADLDQMRFVDFVIMSGRALLYPVYKGTYERKDSRLEYTDANPSRSYAEFVGQWVKDVRRSLDYLETRPDIDADRFGYLALSWGARLGNIVLAVEDRLKLGVLLGGGLPHQQARPEVAETNFAPRVKMPVLMINGVRDAIFPYETNQKPMFELLGTDTKEHLLFDTGHVLDGHRSQMVQKVLSWLDLHLGPV
jgi:cephalosporin-C deacetylase-like acetyl esterase